MVFAIKIYAKLEKTPEMFPIFNEHLCTFREKKKLREIEQEK